MDVLSCLGSLDCGAVPILVDLSVAGGIGGLVRAIVEDTRTDNELTMPFSRKRIALGWLGDALIGGCAAVVGYTFFNVLSASASTAGPDIVKLAGFGIAAGYAGARILNAMLDKFPERKLDLLAARQEALRLYGSRKYALAARKFRDILSQDPSDLQTKANLALSLSWTGDDGVREAISLLEDVLKADPKNAEAWYNLACIRSVANFRQFSDDEVLEPLRKAIELDGTWREYARSDDDFDRFRHAPPCAAYLALTGDDASSPIAAVDGDQSPPSGRC